MLSKVLLISTLILILLCSILFFVIFYWKKQCENIKSEKQALKESFDSLKEMYFRINKELTIEKKHKEELAKKLSDISSMSINDVLHELQNNGG